MNACPFCEIISGKRAAYIIYKDDQVIAFQDIHPVAPTHVLIVPNTHISSLNDIKPSDEILLGHLFTVAHEVAKSEGVETSGYRLIINTGPDAGQTVNHVHLHLIGGQSARYPMG